MLLPAFPAVSDPVKLTVVPATPDTNKAVPVPLSIAMPSNMPDAFATSTLVSPIVAGKATIVDTAMPPVPTTPVT